VVERIHQVLEERFGWYFDSAQ